MCDLIVYVLSVGCVIHIVTTLYMYCADYVEENSIQNRKPGLLAHGVMHGMSEESEKIMS